MSADYIGTSGDTPHREQDGHFCDARVTILTDCQAYGDLVGDDSYFGQLVKDVFGADFGRGRLVLLSGANGVVVELFEFEHPKSERRTDNFEYWKHGIFHICFVEPEIEAAAKRIAETGGKVRGKIWQLFPDKPYKIVFCEDPFGNVIELYSHSTEQTWSNQQRD